MVKSIVPKLFGGAAPANPEVVRALEDLARLKKDRPELAVAVALLTETLPGLFARPITESPPDLSPERAAAKLAGGVPLLRGENIKIDEEAFRRRWLHVCKVMERQQDKSAARSMASALKRGQLHPQELMAALLSGNPDDIYTQADRLGLDAEMTAGLLRLTLFPVLAQMNTALLAFRQGGRWEKGHCPTCGSWPLLGEFRGLEQTRYLRCGWCAAEWDFPRLLCPFCATNDHHELGYFHVEGQEMKYRVATCQACRGYVKMLSTLMPLRGPQVLVADVATIHLDLAAAQRGFLVR
jgi:FdhE protein